MTGEGVVFVLGVAVIATLIRRRIAGECMDKIESDSLIRTNCLATDAGNHGVGVNGVVRVVVTWCHQYFRRHQ